MSDFDIVIKLDPGQPVAGAAKVTEAVAKVEAQAGKTQAAVTGMGDSLAGVAKNVASINFKQAAAGGAKAFQLIDQQLKITDSSLGQVVGSAVKFGALGAQMGGPWGAAIGAIGGALVDLSSKFDDAFGDARRLIAAKEQMEAFANAIAFGASEAHRLAMGFDAMHKALDGLSQSRAIAITGIGLAGIAQYNDELARQKRILGEIRGPQKQYHEELDSLNAMLKSGPDHGGIDHTEFERQIAAINEKFGIGIKKAGEYKVALQGLQGAFPWGDPNNPDAISGGVVPEHLNPGHHWMNVDSLNSTVKTETWDETLANVKSAGDAMKRFADDSSKAMGEAYKKSVDDWATATQSQIDSVAGHLKPVEDALVELATTGTTSWSKMTDAILADLARIAIKQAEMALLNVLFTGSTAAPAVQAAAALNGGSHATGGSYTAPATGGGPDSIPVMFRMNPRETATFTNPGQAPPSGASERSRPDRPLNVVLEDRRDPRDLMRGADFDRAVLDVQRRYPSSR